jgi:DNA-binding transcriptional regulator YiaG
MSNPMENWEKIRTTVPVRIPTLDGKETAETIQVEVDALRNPADGEIYLDGETLEKLDDVKARHMGLLLPDGIKELREQLDVTQKRMAELLQIGEKSYCRWETGRERPSRSMNLLLSSLADGRIDVAYLNSRLKPNFDWRRQVERTVNLKDRVVYFDFGAGTIKSVEENDEALAS